MYRKLNTRISPAAVLAMVALFVSLGGISYAAATIGSSEIENNSIKSKDIRNKTVTGKDVRANALGGGAIKESTLGKVPSAAQADTAGNAASVDGRSAECPAGTRLFLGQCFETAVRPVATSVFVASEVCAEAGRYLPSPLDLRVFRLQPGIDLAAPREYSSSIADDRLNTGVDSFEVITVANTGGVDGELFSVDRPYRCVAPLVN